MIGGIDTFLWLTKEDINCPAVVSLLASNAAGLASNPVVPAVAVDHQALCEMDVTKEIACNASKLTRLNLEAGLTCVPLMTWVDK